MSICITYAGEALIASLQAQGLPLVIDSMIFANVPGQDTAKPADRGQALPTAHIVHSAPIPPEFRSFVNPNQVVYSVLLGSDVGDFAFNWQGLYCSEHQTLIAVAEMPAIEKRANDAGTNTPGNNLTRNFMLQFSGAQALTGLTVEAEVWQLDFTVRLKGIDERERLSNRDIYGRAAFLDAGWLLVKDAGGYHFEPGTGYVEGIRAPLANQTPAIPAPLPCDVFLDVCQAPQGSDVVSLATPRFVPQDVGLPDHIEGAPFRTQHYCVKIARVAADGTVTDLRPKDLPLVDSSFSTHNLDPDAHSDFRAASETVTGILKIAGTVRALLGTDSATAVSPADLSAVLAARPIVDMVARDQIALTNLRQIVNTAVTTGALVQGRMWELLTNEWGAGSIDYALIAGPPNYYTGLRKTVVGNPLANGGRMGTGQTLRVDLNFALPAGSLISVQLYFDAPQAGCKVSVWRQVSGTQYIFVGQSQVFNAVAGLNTIILNTPITVQDGDRLGLYNPTQDVAIYSGGGYSLWVNADVTATTTFNAGANFMAAQATVIGGVSNMTLVQPAAIPLATAPAYGDVYFLYKDDSGSAVLGTDLVIEMSRDNGDTWTTAQTYANETGVGGFDGTYAAIKARANLTGQPSGTSLRARISTHNTKAQRVAAPAVYAE